MKSRLVAPRISRRLLLRGLGATSVLAPSLLAALACQPAAAPAPSDAAKPAAGPADAAKSAAEAAATALPSSGAAEVRLMTHFKLDGKTPRELALARIIEKLHAEHPNVRLAFETIPWPEIPRKHMAAHEAGNAVDLIYATVEHRFVLQGSAEPLDQWIAQWPSGEKDDFIKEAWQSTIFDGKQFGMPQGIFSHTFVLRKDRFDKTTIDWSKPYTWDQFIQAARSAIRDTAATRPGDPGFDESGIQTWGFGHYKARGQGGHMTLDRTMLESGVTIIDPETFKANWVNDTGIAATTMWTDMMKTHKIQSPQDLLANLDDTDNNFAGGVYASYLVGNHRYGSMRQKYAFPAENAILVRMPTFKGDRFGPANIEQRGLFMWSGSKVKEEAWKALEAMGGREAAVVTGTVGELIPWRKSAAEHPDFVNLPPKDAHLKMLLQAISDWGYSALTSPVPYNEHLLLAYHQVVSENVPVEKALRDAADEYDRAVEKALKS